VARTERRGLILSGLKHGASHRPLLNPVRPTPNAQDSLDAIIVPSGREAGHCQHAAELAKRLGCVLIVLASRQSRSGDVRAVAESVGLQRLHVLDFPTVGNSGLPVLSTTKLFVHKGMERRTDVSAKRNFGLAVAHMAGLRRTLFLDDDMKIRKPGHLRAAAGLLRSHDAVGLRLVGFPDNSVVCHANRTVDVQGTFVGAGALVVAADRINSFFPDIYNEDWFFLLDHSKLLPVAVTGRARQQRYDPFDNEERARAEEFGDVLAEGLFAILDHRGRIEDADLAYWRFFVVERRRFIENILNRLPGAAIAARHRERVGRSLLAARDQLLTRISPELCVQYLDAWRQDLDKWAVFRDGLPLGLSVDEAVDWLARRGGRGYQHATAPRCKRCRQGYHARAEWQQHGEAEAQARCAAAERRGA
jgi:hypothetical protein